MKKTLYLIRGLPGSGKTTLALQLCPKWHPFRAAIAADDYPNRYLPDGKINPNISHQQAHAWVRRRVDQWMRLPWMEAIAVNNVFHLNSYLYPFLDLAGCHRYSVQVLTTEVVLLPGSEQAESVHSVPQPLREKWIKEWEKFR